MLTAERGGWLSAVDTRHLGLLLVEAGGGRARPGDAVDHGVALRYRTRLGVRVEAGDELARIHLRRPDDGLAARFRECFTLGDEPMDPPPLLRKRVGG